MEQISVFSLIVTSFPEAITISILGILAIGKFNYLKSKSNYVRIFLYSIVSAVSAYYIRRYMSSIIEITFVNLILICLSYIFIVRLKLYESIMATVFGFIILLVTEVLCLIPLSGLTGINLNEAYMNDFTRFLFFLPERIVQIILIWLSLRYRIRIIDLDSPNIRKKEYYIQLIIYIASISAVMTLTLVIAKLILVDGLTSMNLANSLLLRLNMYLSIFVTIILTLAIKSTHEYYKNKATLNNNEFSQNLQYISNLMNESNYDEAKKVVDNLKSHISNQ